MTGGTIYWLSGAGFGEPRPQSGVTRSRSSRQPWSPEPPAVADGLQAPSGRAEGRSRGGFGSVSIRVRSSSARSGERTLACDLRPNDIRRDDVRRTCAQLTILMLEPPFFRFCFFGGCSEIEIAHRHNDARALRARTACLPCLQRPKRGAGHSNRLAHEPRPAPRGSVPIASGPIPTRGQPRRTKTRQSGHASVPAISISDPRSK
jgi:hypothetical protein